MLQNITAPLGIITIIMKFLHMHVLDGDKTSLFFTLMRGFQRKKDNKEVKERKYLAFLSEDVYWSISEFLTYIVKMMNLTIKATYV